MTTMLERVARAICMATRIDPDRKYKSSDYSAATAPWEFAWHAFQPEARAAIEAMREPTMEMLEAGNAAARERIDLGYYDSQGYFIDIEPDLAMATLDAMIDAAVKSPE